MPERRGEQPDLDGLRLEAERVRQAGALGRSHKIAALFDLFVGAATEGRHLREFDVACEVFDRDSRFDPVTDASVRVHVHRLRRKLEEFYATAESPVWLEIPRGEYRLALMKGRGADEPGSLHEPIEREVPSAEVILQPEQGGAGFRRAAKLWAGWAVAAALALAFAFLYESNATHPEERRLSSLTKSPLWRDFARHGETKMVLIESFDTPGAERLPAEGATDAALPIGVAPALRDLLPIVHHQVGARQYAMAVPMSRVRAEMIKRHSFIYVGYLLGLRQNLPSVFEGSAIDVDVQTGQIVVASTGTRYAPSSPDEKERATHIEYAYIAALKGPGSNRIVVVTGTGNAALQEAAKLASDQASMERLTRAVGNAESFEALYEVRSTGDLGLGARLIQAGARRSPGWASD